MKIWFGCTTSKFLEYEDYYFAIRQHLVNEGHTLLHDWLPETKIRIDQKRERRNVTKIYKQVMEAMQKADVLIVEDSVSSFSTGHQITFGINRRKPTLVLWNNIKNPYYSNTFLHGINSEYLEIAEYDKNSIAETLNKFLNKYAKGISKERFNLVIDSVERQYLDWAKDTYNLSRTELIRDSIRTKLGTDRDYQRYLSGSTSLY